MAKHCRLNKMAPSVSDIAGSLYAWSYLKVSLLIVYCKQIFKEEKGFYLMLLRRMNTFSGDITLNLIFL